MKLDVQRHGGFNSRVTAEGVKNKQSNQSALNVTVRPPWRNTPENKRTLMTMLTLLVQVVSGELQSACSSCTLSTHSFSCHHVCLQSDDIISPTGACPSSHHHQAAKTHTINMRSVGKKTCPRIQQTLRPISSS